MPQANESMPWVKILESTTDYAFGKLFRIVRARLQFCRFDGRLSEPVTRINFERGDSVGILLYDPPEDSVVLIKQFRYPIYAGLTVREQADEPQKAWILEIVAGMVDAGRTVMEVANKELLEEAGIEVMGAYQSIHTIYSSPGGTSERISLYLAEVDHHSRVAAGGGVVAEGEDIQIVDLPFAAAMEMVANGAISDAKTIIALQHLALRKVGVL